MTPDVNVLVAAARSDHSHHAVARGWLEGVLAHVRSGDAAFTLMPMVVASFLRLVTSPKIFCDATGIEEAIGFVDDLLLIPGVQLVELGPEWQRFGKLCMAKRLKGNDLPDAWLAAAVSQRGEHLASFDRGFGKLLRKNEWTLLEPSIT